MPLRALVLLSLIIAGGEPARPAPFKPTLITLELSDVPLDQALDALQKQIDVPIDRERIDAGRRMSLSVNDVPFWDALERLAKAADHRIFFVDSGRKILLVGNERVSYRETPLSIDGPFRVSARRVRSLYDLESERTLTDLELDLHWEPGVSIFLVEPPGKRVKARDNADRDLSIVEAGSRLPASGGGLALAVRFTEIPRSSRTIRQIEGEFTVIGAAGMLKFEFEKWNEKEQSSTNDGVIVKVRNDFKPGGDLWTARVAIEYPEGGPRLESFEASAWLADNEAYLVSRDGKTRFDVNGGTEVISQSERRAEINYRWVPQGNAPTLGDPKDWKLVVKTPSKLIEVPVKFKLENIPLP